MAVNPQGPAAEPALPVPAEDVDEFLSRPPARVTEVIAGTPAPILVLGAGGKIGLHLCAMLRRAMEEAGRRDPVMAVSRFRTLRDAASFEKFGIPTRVCDLTVPPELAALPEAPTIFFLAGVKFGTSGAPELLQKTNVAMPKRVAERFRHSRIVVFSTGCVYPFVAPASGGATEETPPAPVGDYAASCLAREKAFADASRGEGTAVALVRLNYSVEFRYGLLVDIAERVLRGKPVDVSTGHVNVIWQSDAVAHAIQALGLAAAPAVPVNIAGREILSVRWLANRFGELLKRPVRIVGREADTAWLSNAARAHRLFGAPPTSAATMVEWTAAWLANGGTTWGKPTAFERRDGRF